VFALNNLAAAALLWLAMLYAEALLELQRCTSGAPAPQAPSCRSAATATMETARLARLASAAPSSWAGAASEHIAAVSSAQRRLYWRVMSGALAAGLGLCNQHTLVLLVAPLAAWVLLSGFPWLRWRGCAHAAGYFVAGLLPYLLLPVTQAFAMQPGSWGDTRTLGGFLRHLLRSDYGTFRLLARDDQAAEGIAARTTAYFVDLLWTQSPPLLQAALALGMAVSVFAVWATYKPASVRSGASRAVGAPPLAGTGSVGVVPGMLAGCWLVYLAVFHTLSNMPLNDDLLRGIHARFWMQPNLLAFAIAGIGACLAVLAVAEGSVLRWRAGAVDGLLSKQRHCSLAATRRAAAVALAASCCAWPAMQYSRHVTAMDQSRNIVFESYGRAMLEPLPRSAVLITGYDMQWTSLRYLQTCEGVRRDVAVLNAPVMSYSWFAAYRASYPNVSWPGSHLVAHLTAPHAAGGFSLTDFFAANVPDEDGGGGAGAALLESYAQDPPHPTFVARTGTRALLRQSNPGRAMQAGGGVFYAGAFVYSTDSAHEAAFDMRPFGTVAQVVCRMPGCAATRSWRALAAPPPGGAGTRMHSGCELAALTMQEAAWRAAVTLFSGNVSVTEYDGSTWERAARIDFWTQAHAYAAWQLDCALSGTLTRPAGADMDTAATLAAAAVLEVALTRLLETNSSVAATLYKNLGLAYLRLVRWAGPLPLSQLPTLVPFATAGTRFPYAAAAAGDDSAWRAAASMRVLETWGHFASLPAARGDAGYESIVTVVTTLTSALHSSMQQAGGR
jgi:hypothetical protein